MARQRPAVGAVAHDAAGGAHFLRGEAAAGDASEHREDQDGPTA
jgi:hypothetical protein